MPQRLASRLAIDRYGDGPNTVVLAHGGGQTRHAWRGTAERLAAAGFAALAFDLRGHGESPRAPEGIYTAATFIDDVREVVAHAPALPVLAGASLGGIVSLLAVAEAGVAARALVLVDVGVRAQPAGVERIVGFMRAYPDGFASLEEAARVVAAYANRPARSTTTNGLAKNLQQGSDGRWRWHWDPALLENFDLATTLDENRIASALRKLDVPLLVVRGGRSDVLDAETAAETARLGRGEVVDVGAAAHMVAGDANDAFSTALLTFLQSLGTPAF